MGELLHGELTASIIGCFYKSYNKLDYGFVEHVYAAALDRELKRAGHTVAREVPSRIMYEPGDTEPLAWFRLDRIVDGLVVVELKAGQALPPGAEKQVYNYLRSTDLEVGLLLHYGPKPTFSRYMCTRDRKGRVDLRHHTERTEDSKQNQEKDQI
jgi:GxxExxY protein